jgi:hypothetical protein
VSISLSQNVERRTEFDLLPVSFHIYDQLSPSVKYLKGLDAIVMIEVMRSSHVINSVDAETMCLQSLLIG